MARWRTAGLARPWTAELAVLDGDTREPAPGPMRWAAPAGLRSLVQELSAGLDVRTERPVRHVGPGPQVDGEHADVVVLAMPDPQALRLVHPSSPGGRDAGRPGLAAEHRGGRGLARPAVGRRCPAAFVNGHPDPHPGRRRRRPPR